MATPWRWILSSVDLGTIEWYLNPNSGGLPVWEKQLDVTSSAGGAPVIFEGRQRPITMPFSGVILEKDHWDFFLEWYESGYAVQITQDLRDESNTRLVIPYAYLTKFAPKRKVRHSHPWAADYDCEALVWGFSSSH